MREIKCRGFHKDKNGSKEIIVNSEKVRGDWVYGYLIGSDVIVGDVVEFCDESFNTEFWCRVVPETVGEITPWRDVTGDIIWCGDIILCLLTGEKFEIVLDDTGAGFLFASSDDEAFDFYSFEDEYGELGFIKIGNIHEHPELRVLGLEVEK